MAREPLVRTATPEDAEAACAVIRRSIVECCIEDHHGDSALLAAWLANKTPDVRETTLAGKGAYHRLLVGPPSSRSQASELCTQLKASGYKDCWVTAY